MGNSYLRSKDLKDGWTCEKQITSRLNQTLFKFV
jgi:hypothetical protein